MKTIFKVGARDSKLSLLQAQGAIEQLTKELPYTFTLCPYSSPGDRDQATDLRLSPGDFFTRDLDAAVLSGEIDCAIHSAKDLPAELAEGLDWFWLPWREDPRDCIVARTPTIERIGVSSERRDRYAETHYPTAQRLPLRGTIPMRLQQLDEGHYDAIITAVAALNRLGLADRITHIIPSDELPAPDGQGVLAVTFRRNDPAICQWRNLYLKAVRFVGAGVGDAELCTQAGVRELSTADVVIYDALMDETLLTQSQRKDRRDIYVGKRSGAHAMKQPEITALIEQYVRRGLRVVRLKGGDPGIFGRLVEETEALEHNHLPFIVYPGISALQAATTSTGMLLTRRGESCGFHVETPRSQGTQTPDVYFMALGVAETIATRYPAGTPCAIVRNAGFADMTIQQLTTEQLKNEVAPTQPGLLIVGPCVHHTFPLNLGPLQGKRIWVTGSQALAERARTLILDLGGKPIVRPLVTFKPTATIKIRPSKGYNLLVCTSPTAAKLFFEQLISPLFTIPKKIAVTGPGTAAVFEPTHIDLIQPTHDFSAKGLLATLPEDLTGYKILRIRSEEAGPALSEALKARGAKVKDLPFYTTQSLKVEIPAHDAVFLASSSAVTAWHALQAPQTVDRIVMGFPTAKALETIGSSATVIAQQQTVAAILSNYATYLLKKSVQ